MHLPHLLLLSATLLASSTTACKFIFYNDASKEVFHATKSGCYNVASISTSSYFGSGFQFAGLATDTKCGNALVFQAAQVGSGGFVIGGLGGKASDVHKTSSLRLTC
ncbi:uncharacterized protein EV422DRAFT_509121 [Fimicolochytrium jonesii]|uniref:uncharacterized protein n=1 Tax=Fimicolochytrium jonesii TaxID=1396493 RepID=UPI0022FF28C9|nr:uncharacterized protein EV422DRAFT_509121 [Fimicolochytrium jonesii]KAI8817294.1 hypothetical protein EV422DRAFT_509121 [Fimicolochytrium jonesii]